MKIGANDIAAVKIGSVDVNKVYLGSNLVWQKQAESYLLELFPNSQEAYSLRQLQSNGGVPYPLVLVRRSSDNAEQSFTETQIIDGTLEAFCGAGNGQVVSWYDQSGNNNHVNQSTASNQPYIVISGNLVTDNGKPTLYFNSLSELVSVNNTNYGTSSRSIFITINLLEGISTKGIISLSNLSTGAGKLWIVTPEIATRANTYTWITSTPLPQNNQSLLTNIYASSANLFDGNNMYLDGSAIVRTLGANGVIDTSVGKMYIGSNGLGSNRVLANISEIVNYKSDQSTNRTQIESNINSHYNIYAEDILEFNPYNIWDSEHITIDGTTTTLHDFNTFGDKYDMSNPSASNQPTYNANSANFNGLPSFTFDGISQYFKGDIVDYRNTDTSGVVVNVFRHLSGVFIIDLNYSLSTVTNRYLNTAINTNSYRVILISTELKSFRGGTDIATGSPSSVVAYADTGASYSMNINGNSETITMISGSNDGEAWFNGNPFDTISIGGIVLSSGVLFGNLEWCMSGYFPYTDESTTLEIVNFLKNKYGVA